MSKFDDKTLTHLLDAIDEAADGTVVCVREILAAIGDRSIMPVVLAISILIVSPLSGIPTVPTLSSVILLILMGQAFGQRRHLWLPEILLRRELASARVQTATGWLRRPCAWLDAHSRPRLRVLTSGVLRPLTLVVCMLTAATFPFLEILPFVSSFCAGAIAMIAFGVITRDGLWVLAGYVQVAVLAGLAVWAWPG
ncbi:exopolysaccharide biosynthesis protein [Sulfitobacter pseudonitzschiae]|uniref:Exopolysaccharide biosynthesis protein n=1 Tax=Pseudosulfitobacter pseudonitzschiae TaxID=1402135 RepID=A0A9Q2NK43_9RHOB|nr:MULTISPECIES: exopolysaccharide biosynthesis protein [Roseobacteraceae]MBM2290790.1 exopolysaccharide biosynthesis protein [Pseudosulfitobacter pseudonitzschiae]MBM2295708.1 exopolysaccharide biosynthesis protein [Pseudosulfitobacter pseudonitzschiae]MBM2300620.1 exopolysaccharide biosynthesis protein [Pseudosulfitobacter pseudonitzschiae]MBM2310405.1 exopolysaccharide biosynthesis protein [Pseudosulfitobacter pseudonitzschiae]MBM2315317.1 exopolysaccharide biosynthesis protein [Pseudosulfi|tara:strand:+ start:1244 stop:1831 length:588 start_codon:yes stop_codon:yes gene_type:complete